MLFATFPVVCRLVYMQQNSHIADPSWVGKLHNGPTVWSAILCGLLASCASAAQTVTYPFLGVTLYQRTEKSPRPLKISVAEIDLAAPGISFLMTPRGPAPQPVYNGVPDETVIQTTRQFVNSSGAQLAINASYYDISNIHTVNGLSWTNNLGLTASEGDVYSPWLNETHTDNNYDDALNITANNSASIVKMPSNGRNGYGTTPSVTLYNTVTGKNRLLTNGALSAPSSCTICGLNPRTAVGLTAGNTKLIMMTIDGRRTGVSEGVTLVELAGYLDDYGVTNAINLDGGGSTQMAANYYNDGQNARLVNTPSESERSVGTNLGVFALPNGDFNLNGTIDAGDYVVWRKSVGGTLGYTAWRSRYGAAGGSGTELDSSAIPEPTALPLLATLIAATWLRARHRAI